MAYAKHHNVRFSKEELAYELPEELDSKKLRYVGRGVKGVELARQISRAHGAEKRKLVESLPRLEKADSPKSVASIQLEPDVAAVFKDAKSVNRVLRALIESMPTAQKKRFRKTA